MWLRLWLQKPTTVPPAAHGRGAHEPITTIPCNENRQGPSWGRLGLNGREVAAAFSWDRQSSAQQTVSGLTPEESWELSQARVGSTSLSFFLEHYSLHMDLPTSYPSLKNQLRSHVLPERADPKWSVLPGNLGSSVLLTDTAPFPEPSVHEFCPYSVFLTVKELSYSDSSPFAARNVFCLQWVLKIYLLKEWANSLFLALFLDLMRTGLGSYNLGNGSSYPPFSGFPHYYSLEVTT